MAIANCQLDFCVLSFLPALNLCPCNASSPVSYLKVVSSDLAGAEEIPQLWGSWDAWPAVEHLAKRSLLFLTALWESCPVFVAPLIVTQFSSRWMTFAAVKQSISNTHGPLKELVTVSVLVGCAFLGLLTDWPCKGHPNKYSAWFPVTYLHTTHLLQASRACHCWLETLWFSAQLSPSSWTGRPGQRQGEKSSKGLAKVLKGWPAKGAGSCLRCGMLCSSSLL